jgi:hypothetical protein
MADQPANSGEAEAAGSLNASSSAQSAATASATITGIPAVTAAAGSSRSLIPLTTIPLIPTVSLQQRTLGGIPLTVFYFQQSPPWYPENIPSFYLIIQNIGLGLRVEAFRWLTLGRNVADHRWRDLTVQILEDELDPNHQYTPEYRRQLLWASSFPPSHYMHPLDGPMQPGMSRYPRYPLIGHD